MDISLSAPQNVPLENHKPKWLDQDLFPYESRFIDLDGSRIHYVDEGSGPPLLMLHPAPASSFIYRTFISRLRSSHRCLALDYPGFGLSPMNNGNSLSLASLSNIVQNFVRKIDLQGITMMVHDASGAIGLGAATADPERYEGFILTDTFAFPLDDYWPMRTMMRAVTSRPFRWINREANLMVRLVSSIAPVRRRLSANEREVYQQLFASGESRDRILDLMQELLVQRDYLARVEQGIRNNLSDRPALIMYGQFDPARLVGWPGRFEGLFPNHRSAVIPWEGHFPHEGSPDAMIEEIVSWRQSLNQRG